jgi:hypothetical protein
VNEGNAELRQLYHRVWQNNGTVYGTELRKSKQGRLILLFILAVRGGMLAEFCVGFLCYIRRISDV